MKILGYLLVCAALGHFVYGLRVSYRTNGGAIGQLPMVLYAFPPTIFLMLAGGVLSPYLDGLRAMPGWPLVIGFPLMIFGNAWLLFRVGRKNPNAGGPRQFKP